VAQIMSISPSLSANSARRQAAATMLRLTWSLTDSGLALGGGPIEKVALAEMGPAASPIRRHLVSMRRA